MTQWPDDHVFALVDPDMQDSAWLPSISGFVPQAWSSGRVCQRRTLLINTRAGGSGHDGGRPAPVTEPTAAGPIALKNLLANKSNAYRSRL